MLFHHLSGWLYFLDLSEQMKSKWLYIVHPNDFKPHNTQGLAFQIVKNCCPNMLGRENNICLRNCCELVLEDAASVLTNQPGEVNMKSIGRTGK